MSELITWSAVAAENNLPSPNGFPENMAPSGVNNSARELMAAVRRAFDTVGLISSGALIDFDAVLADAISDVDATRLGGQLPAFYLDFANFTGFLEYAQISIAAASILRNALLFAGENSAFYRNASNINAGILDTARLNFGLLNLYFVAEGTSFIPTGWTVANPSIGVWTITHNLNTTKYGVIPVAKSYSSDIKLSSPLNINLNTFQILTGNEASLETLSWFAIVFVWP